MGWGARRALELVDAVSRPASVPPRRLRARTGAPGRREFARGGREAASVLLEGIGELQSVLDFGCGAGRVLPWIAQTVPGTACFGVDVDVEAVGWAEQRWPSLRWMACDFEPPLAFEDDSFDLIYSISVFSHLDAGRQDRWLSELTRVLRPGGSALLSVHGGYAFEQFRRGAVRSRWVPADAFERGPIRDQEFVFTPYVRTRWNAVDLPGVGSNYGLAFHGHGYVRDHWAPWLAVRDVRERAIAGWQDLIVCNAAAGA